jgi:hypothetical protein
VPGSRACIRTKYLNEARLQLTTSGNENVSESCARRSSCRTRSRAAARGVNSNSSTKRLELADNFDFTVGKHQMRVGALVEGRVLFELRRAQRGRHLDLPDDRGLSGRPRSSRSAWARWTPFSQYQAASTGPTSSAAAT